MEALATDRAAYVAERFAERNRISASNPIARPSRASTP